MKRLVAASIFGASLALAVLDGPTLYYQTLAMGLRLPYGLFGWIPMLAQAASVGAACALARFRSLRGYAVATVAACMLVGLSNSSGKDLEQAPPSASAYLVETALSVPGCVGLSLMAALVAFGLLTGLRILDVRVGLGEGAKDGTTPRPP